MKNYQFAILGYPLGHSLSPLLHELALKENGLVGGYRKIEIEPQQFAEKISEIKAGQKLNGFNITIPFKTQIIPFLDELDAQAEAAGAVNTVRVSGKKWIGFNTDISGFLSPSGMRNAAIENALIIGAGGAARAVFYALSNVLKVPKIFIAARDEVKANAFGESVSPLTENSNLSFIKPGERCSPVQLLVNATPVGTAPRTLETPWPKDLPITDDAIVYDLVYNPWETLLLKSARKKSDRVKIINGAEMLVGQAAAAFELWTGCAFPVQQGIRLLKSELAD